MSTDLAIVGILLACLGLISGGVFLTSGFHWLIKIGFATALVLVAIYAWTVAKDIFGFPVPGLPPDGSTVEALMVDQPHNIIALWVIERDRPRNYAIPYDDDLARRLLEADADASKKHGRMVFHIRDNTGRGGNNLWSWIAPAADSPDDLNIDVVPAIPEKEKAQ